MSRHDKDRGDMLSLLTVVFHAAAYNMYPDGDKSKRLY
jgi:hypothetical protein